MLLSLPDGDYHASADARHTLDTLDLEPVSEAQSGGQQLVIASAESPSQAGVDVVVEIAQDYGWRLLAGGKPRLRAVRWPRLLEYLSGGLDGQPVLTSTSTWDYAKQSLRSTATARALASAILRCHKACNDVWQDLWSQRCEGGCIPSRSILPLVWSGCGTTAPVRVHQCASSPLCASCRKRAGKGWPKATWALRHSGQLSWSVWKAIQLDLPEYRWMDCAAQMTRLRCFPCYCGGLRWTATPGSYGCGITEGFLGMARYVDDAM